MKRILALVLIVILAGCSVAAGPIRPPQGFEGRLWGSTLALYGTKDKSTHFLCTAEPIEKTKDGYILLSAGHCVQEVPADVQFSVADEIGGKLTPVTVVKAYDGDGLDFSIFRLTTTENYTPFDLGTEDGLRVGDRVLNPNFALGLGKQFSHGVISSQGLSVNPMCDFCAGLFIVQGGGGPGSSGSAVISEKTHKVIGILIAGAPMGNTGFEVEPISWFAKFMAGPNQPHPPAPPSDQDE